MAVFCQRCNKKTYNEFNCDFCNYQIKKRVKTSKSSILVNEDNNNIFIKIIAGAVVVIALVGIYFVVQNYTEDTEEEKVMKIFYGTTDKEEIEEINRKAIEKMNKDMEDSSKKQVEMIKKMFENK